MISKYNIIKNTTFWYIDHYKRTVGWKVMIKTNLGTHLGNFLRVNNPLI